MTNFVIFTDNDIKSLDRKIRFYFRDNKDKWLINVDIAASFNPKSNLTEYVATVVYGIEDKDQ